MADLMLTTLVLATAGALAGGAAGALAGRAFRRAVRTVASPAGEEAARIQSEAETERATALREAEIAAREEALQLKAEAEAALLSQEEALSRRGTVAVQKEIEVASRARGLEEQRARLKEREAPLSRLEAERAGHRRARKEALEAARAMLEKVSGQRAEEQRRMLVDAEIEAARGGAAQLLRQTAESASDPDNVRQARRVLGIAATRFSAHYLTERHPSLIPLPPGRHGRPGLGEVELRAIEAVANIKLTLNEEGDGVRLEGLDGVGREVARRCLHRLQKRPSAGGEAVVTRLAKEVAAEMDREIVELGRRAFSNLGLQRSHPEIVKLVGRLNWRTSYTQNQWKHAVESAFLCGMMAEEVGLDRVLARRAALLHDIGKALTHELDGSHAVIGADYARRLGESELVANAIGAHHTDEPFNSAYAYLVAASDAMSGARPGARRQTDDNYVARIADLERISRGFGGVAEAFAVQGGREVRVVVREGDIDDLAAVALSSKIADAISKEMTFPGQIRVTVIREFRAIETAS